MTSPTHPVPQRLGVLLFSHSQQQTPSSRSTSTTSPVTDLARNLGGLSTGRWGTPRRRISWSSEGTPEFVTLIRKSSTTQDSPADFPISHLVDSAVLQDKLLKDVSVADNCLNTSTSGTSRMARKGRTLPVRAFLKDSFGKENVPRDSSHQASDSLRFSHLLPKKTFSLSPTKSSSGHQLSDFNSRDSGCGLQEGPFLQEPFAAPSHPPPRRTTISPLKPHSSLKRLDSAGSSISGSSSDRSSSVGTSVTDEDVDDGFCFDMDYLDLENPFALHGICGLPSGMQQVLEAPLQSNLKEEEEESSAAASSSHLLLKEENQLRLFSQQSTCTDSSPKKPPIRRCLSMVLESPLSSRPCLSPKEKLLQAVDRNNNSNNYLRRPEDTRKRLLQEDAGEKAFKKPCEPPFCAGMHHQLSAGYQTFYEAKRRKSVSFFTKSPSDTMLMPSRRILLQRSHSEAETIIAKALHKSSHNPNLIGDCSGTYALPLVKGRHDDLKTITSSTLSHLIEGKYNNEVKDFKIVDCRYPYEYNGGHIHGAYNMYTKESVMEFLIRQNPPLSSTTNSETSAGPSRSILVFHCEFSSERGPKLCRYLRNMDREANKDNYPHLFHPEIYLLEGGYKEFYSFHKELCTPQDYLPMLHKDHEQDLRKFRAKSKSWSGETKSRMAVRPGLKL